MTSSLPDSFSFSDLEAMLESAPKEEEIHSQQQSSDDDDKSPTEEDFMRAVNAGLDLMVDQINDPVVHKAALVQIANNMIVWHTKVGENCFADGEIESGTAWLRDAGKWQSILATALSIMVGPNDCFVNESA